MRRILDYRNILNRKHPLNRGLVSEWAVLPGLAGGKFLYDVVSRNHGTLTNGSIWTPNSRPGGYGSLSIVGSTDLVSITDSNLLSRFNGRSVFTISFWVRKSAYATDNAAICFRENSDTSTLFVIYPYDNGVGNGLRVYYGGENIMVIYSDAPSAGTWNHFIFTSRSNVDHEAYVNGKSIITSSNNKSLDAALTHFEIGNCSAFSQGLTGDIDDVCLYETGCNASQAQQLYQESRLGNPNRYNWLDIYKYAGGIQYISKTVPIGINFNQYFTVQYLEQR